MRGSEVGEELRAALDEHFSEILEGGPPSQSFQALLDDSYQRLIAPDLEEGFWGLAWVLRTQSYAGGARRVSKKEKRPVGEVCGDDVQGMNTRWRAREDATQDHPRSRCPECEADYCLRHYPTGPELGWAAGIDARYGEATCPQGHSRIVWED